MISKGHTQLVEELEDYAKNYKCKKCSRFYCSHMLKARASKYKERINEAVKEMFGI